MKNRKLKYAEKFEFPPSVMAGGVNLSIYADAGCTIDNFGEILTYNSELLRLDTELGVLRIDGKNLMIEEMDTDTLMLTGRVTGAFYEKNERL